MAPIKLSRPIVLALVFLIVACATLLFRNVRTSFKVHAMGQSRSDTIVEAHKFLIYGNISSGLLATRARKDEDANVVRIAYCVYPQSLRKGEPVLGGEYLARKVAAIGFADKKVEFVSCLAVPELLPPTIEPHSREGLSLLGLYNVHLRFCSYGSSHVIEETLRALEKLSKQKLRLIRQRLDEGQLEKIRDSKELLFAPHREVLVYSDGRNRVVGPLISRTNREAWHESVAGVALQFETKISPMPRDSIAMYMPYAYESFGRVRWNGDDPKRVIESHGENFGHPSMREVKESVTRNPNTFSAANFRRTKEGFMAMVNSNCRREVFLPRIRGMFGFAVHNITGKAVHNLGRCPNNPDGAIKAGISVKERAALQAKHPFGKGNAPTELLLAPYKFSIVFENANADGYITEKIVTAYNAKSIPVYWGGGAFLPKVINRKAFVHCDLPKDITTMEHVLHLASGLCPQEGTGINALKSMNPQCFSKLEEKFSDELFPHFKLCIEQIRYLDGNNTAYDEMLSEPLATVDDLGYLTGYWNESFYAQGIRTVFDMLDYSGGSRRLTDLLDQM